jgi:hypothetical protein
MKRPCPVCSRHFFDVGRSEDVCEKHQNWLVTVCDTCREACFSDCVGECAKCARGDAPHATMTHRDHRAYLRFIGQDDDSAWG